jgi:hypothetical protein
MAQGYGAPGTERPTQIEVRRGGWEFYVTLECATPTAILTPGHLSLARFCREMPRQRILI